MRGNDMAALFGPFQGEAHYLSIQFDRQVSKGRKHGQQQQEEEGQEEEEEGLLGNQAVGEDDLDSEERDKLAEARRKDLEDDMELGGTAGFIQKVKSPDPRQITWEACPPPRGGVLIHLSSLVDSSLQFG